MSRARGGLAQHIHLLMCPRTSEALRMLDSQSLSEIGQALTDSDVGAVRDGCTAADVDAVLVNESGSLAYLVIRGIVHLLPGHAVDGTRLEGAISGASNPSPTVRTSASGDSGVEDQIKENVKSFYDSYGWKKDGDEYGDAKLFIDRRKAVEQYQREVSSRIARVLQEGGEYLLNAASGPVPQGVKTDYATNFSHHVCLDISVAALEEAQKNLQGRGVFVQGDVTTLPFRDSMFDGAASLHTIYHVPKNQQRQAFLELHRILKPGSPAAIAYNWGKNAVIMNILTLPIQLLRFAKKRLPGPKNSDASVSKLYFYGHSRRWFESQKWPFDYQIKPLQVPNKAFFSLYVHEGFGAQQVLGLVRWLENQHEELALKLAYYPLIIIRK